MKRLKLNGEVTEQNVRNLLAEAQVQNIPIDLSNRDLTELIGTRIFSDKNLSDSDLSGVTATGLDLSGVSLCNAKLVRATITKSNFTRVNFTCADVWNADFSYTTSFDGVIGLEAAKNLGSAKFYGSNISEPEKAKILKANPSAKFGYLHRG